MKEEIFDRAIEYIEALFKNDHGGHGADHTLRVHHNAVIIAEEMDGCDMDVVRLAALLHDADDHKLFHTENNANARAFLAANGVPREQAEAVCRAIDSVSFSRNKGKAPDTPEGRIVQDADRLDAIGAIGIARTFAYGGEHGRPMEDSIQHFYDKLLLLKDMMNTEPARRLAKERHAVLEAFLREWKKETGEEP